MSTFGANKIITEHIKSTDLHAYFVGFDLDDSGNSLYRVKPLIELLTNVIPEFAFGHHYGTSVDINEIVCKLIESAKSIYNVEAFKKARDLSLSDTDIDDSDATDDEKKILKRGEFGELILHLLLRDFHETIPLVSKIYFKDAENVAVHGFDAVHIQPDAKSLWLGESKLYQDGKRGVSELVNDIKEHINRDYLKSEFSIIYRKLNGFDDIPNKTEWLSLLSSSTTLKEQLESITIPLLCTYSSNVFEKHSDEKLAEFIKDFENEIKALKAHFDKKNDHALKDRLNIILLLFPIKCKKELVKGLHEKLTLMQKLGG